MKIHLSPSLDGTAIDLAETDQRPVPVLSSRNFNLRAPGQRITTNRFLDGECGVIPEIDPEQPNEVKMCHDADGGPFRLQIETSDLDSRQLSVVAVEPACIEYLEELRARPAAWSTNNGQSDAPKGTPVTYVLAEMVRAGIFFGRKSELVALGGQLASYGFK